MHGKARPDPDGRRHRHRQEHDAGVDARAAQPADGRPHPDDRGPDRVPVHATRSRSSTSARSAATRRSCRSALKNALRQAPDCILIGEIRDRETMTAAISLRAVGPPRAGHAARQQQLPRARPDPVVLPAGGAPRAAGRPGRRPAADRLAAPGAHRRRRPHAGGRGDAQHQAGLRADRAAATSAASRKRWRSRWPKARRPSSRTSPA